jgi:hypothetical protein
MRCTYCQSTWARRADDIALCATCAARLDRREPAVPRGSFDAWVLEHMPPVCPVTDDPCTRACDPQHGPCERQS